MHASGLAVQVRIDGQHVMKGQGWVRCSWWRVVALTTAFVLLMFALILVICSAGPDVRRG
jgi:hypothetical protein